MVFLNIKKKLLNINVLSKSFLIAAIIIHIVLILSLVFKYYNSFVYDCNYIPGQGADFYAFYQAGYNVIFGLNPYKIYAGYYVVPYSYAFIYHPFIAFTFCVFFALFPPLISYWIWVIMNIVLIWCSCYLTFRICKNLNKPRWVAYIAVSMWLCFTPCYLELYAGQINLFVGILTFVSFYTEFRNKEAFSTFFWLFGSIMKTLPYLLIPSVLSSGKSRKVAYLIVISIILTVIFPIIYIYNYFYFGLFKTGAFKGNIGHYANFEFRSILYYLSVYFTSNNIWFAQNTLLISAILLLTFFGLACLATIYSEDYLISITLFVCAYFLVSSGIFESSYTFLLPFLVILWIRNYTQKKWFLIFLLFAIPTPYYLWNLWNLWYFPFVLIFKLFKIVPTIILFVFLLIKAFKTPRQDKFINSIKEVKNNILFGFKKQDLKKLPNVFVE